MKKILLSIGSILFVSALLAGGTGAFLADSGTSTGNTFASGVVDLKIDNESYYTDNDGKLIFSPSTSWALSNLAGKFFFNFLDLKPGDIGEDTISLHVNNNNAWACMNVAVTGTPENGQNEPEAAIDPTIGTNDGELQNNLYFTFWADDGDNVFEAGEKVFKEGLVKDIFNGTNWSLADASTNIWSGTGPLLGGTTKYIGKAWCFGTVTATPKPQDGLGKTGSNGPLNRGTGFSCNGEPIGNIVQSDGIKADVSFTVAQSRNNGTYLCQGGDPGNPPVATSTLFSENFNSCSKDYSDDNNGGHDHLSWSKKWQCNDNKEDDNSNKQCTQNLDLSAAGKKHKEQLVTPSVNTQGYHAITLKYDRKTDDTNAPPQPVGSRTLTVDYSVNDGSSWTVLETVTGESASTTKTWSLSPSADNKLHVKVRFTLVGDDSTNHAYIDNVVITGVTP